MPLVMVRRDVSAWRESVWVVVVPLKPYTRVLEVLEGVFVGRCWNCFQTLDCCVVRRGMI
jgi:hypothetical protein